AGPDPGSRLELADPPRVRLAKPRLAPLDAFPCNDFRLRPLRRTRLRPDRRESYRPGGGPMGGGPGCSCRSGEGGKADVAVRREPGRGRCYCLCREIPGTRLGPGPVRWLREGREEARPGLRDCL